ncbi:MAG: hypothetical protein QOH53_926, partial [Ilumatobacteraceae bacterium]
LLMQALHGSGRQAEALRVFQNYRSQLGEETGLEPSAAIVALDRSIADGHLHTGAMAGGRLLRGYVVHDVIGEGGFGRIYAATQPGTEREVAIKVIRAELADRPDFVRSFEVEAQLVARLEHPHIVPLYDYWREPGGAYLVFRLLRGGSASTSLVNDGPWSLNRVSRLVEELGSAMVSAHSAGVVHCDVKASNVLFDEAGNAYLTDFGIARTVDPVVTDSGVRADAQTDIRDFGLLLWELLTGTAPFGPSASTVRRPVDLARAPSLLGRRSDVSERIDAVIGRATAADPARRFSSMAELVLAWRSAVGRPEGVLTPVGDGRAQTPEPVRQRAAHDMTLTAMATVNPYMGLRPFEESDAGNFFGRDELADELADVLAGRRFVAVVGPSGSGKSSLVRAGLLPRLRHRRRCVVATLTPGEHPLSSLRDALTEVAIHAVDDDLGAGLAQVAEAAGSELVVVVDQFEECWSIASLEEREQFLQCLVTGAARESELSPVRVVVTIRADLYDRPLQHADVGRLVAGATFAVPAMTPSQIREAIIGPAAAGGVVFDDAVVATMIAELTAEPAALPLLQFALAELYEHRENGHIREAALDMLGGVAGAIGRRADELYSELEPGAQSQVRRLFGRLVTPGEGSPDTRRRARLAEIPADARPVVNRFVGARLLVSDRDAPTREPVIEVAHEALIASWGRLRGWLEDDRRWLAQLHHLSASTRVWENAGTPDAELYRGARLEAALEALPAHGDQLTSSELEFVDRSRIARDATLERDRRTARRLRRLLTAVAFVLVAAVVAGVIALTQRQQARAAADEARNAQRRAEIEALIGRSRGFRSSQRDVAALLAVEAFRLADNPRTRSALFETFTSDPGFLGYRRVPPELGSAQGIALPDGRVIVTGHDQRPRTFDLETGALGNPWQAMVAPLLGYSRLRTNTDGSLIVQIADVGPGNTESLIGIYDTHTGQLVGDTIKPPFYVGDAIIDADSSTLYATGGANGDLIAYSLRDHHIIGTLRGLPDDANEGPNQTYIDGNPCVLASLARQPDASVVGGTAGIAFVDRGLLAVGSPAGTIRLIDPYTLRPARQFKARAGATAHLVAIDSGTSLLAYGTAGVVRLDVDSGNELWSVRPDFVVSPCNTIAVSEPAGIFFYADQFGTLQERGLATGAAGKALDAQNGNAGSLWVTDSGNELVTFGDNEPVVARWRLDGTGPLSRRLTPGFVANYYSPDGTRVSGTYASGGTPDGTDPAVLDATTGAVVDPLDDLVSPPVWLDDHTVASIKAPGDPLVAAKYALQTGQLQVSTVVFPGPPISNSFVEANKPFGWLPFDVNGHVELWKFDIARFARVEPTISVNGYTRMWVDRAAARLAVGTSDGITIYDAATGGTIGKIERTDLRAVYITPSDMLIAGTLGGELVEYDLNTLQPIRTLGGNTGLSQEMYADTSGTLLVTRSGAGDVNLYDISTGERIGTSISVPDGEANGVGLRSDGKELFLGGSSTAGTLFWDLDPQHWVEAACRLAGRNLTREEWAANIGTLARYTALCP